MRSLAGRVFTGLLAVGIVGPGTVPVTAASGLFAVGPGSFADEHGELDQEKFAVSRRDAARRLIAAVDATLLARRAAAGEGSDEVDVMEISLVYSSEHNCLCIYGVVRRYYFHDHRHEADITLSRVDGWLRFAERHVKGSFILELPLVAPVAARTPRRGEARSQAADTAATSVTDDGEAAAPADEEVVVVELPRSTRAETMSLTLGYATASVPAAAVAGAFRALTELTLQHAIIDDDGGDLRLGHLLSSPCCPRLRRLSLRHVGGVATLRLDAAAALEELRLVHLPDLRWLDVDAPGLRLQPRRRLQPPALFRFLRHGHLGGEAGGVLFDGAAAVRRIKKLRLMSFGGGGGDDQYDANAAAVWLLKNCNAVVHLGVKLDIYVDEGHEDTIKDVPQLPSVTSLTIKAALSPARGLGRPNDIIEESKSGRYPLTTNIYFIVVGWKAKIINLTCLVTKGIGEPCAWEFGVHRFNGVSVSFGHRLIAGEKIIASSSLL
uniref:Uncharacterized protein n=1 Tax=Oryza sativa subsp. japonica TaxID=39947 RepID=Q2QPU4_ORYSJ|nr:hypothetical protein LOC_Os12g33270 [Oryza sativa Japonica Group]